MVGEALARCCKKISVWSFLSPYGRDLQLEDSDSFRNFFRMEPATFDELLHKFKPRLTKQNIWYRQAIGTGKNDSSAECAGYLNAVVSLH